MKIKHYSSLILLCAAVLLPAGCATDDNGSTANNNPPAKKEKDNRPITDKLKVGMTKDEVRAALGNPKGTTTSSAGTEIWQYNDNAKAWIPFYAVSGGKFNYTIITFDTDGKVKEWSTSDHAMF